MTRLATFLEAAAVAAGLVTRNGPSFCVVAGLCLFIVLWVH